MNVTANDVRLLKKLLIPLREYSWLLVSMMEGMPPEEARRDMESALLKSADIPIPDDFTDIQKEYIELRAEYSFLLRVQQQYAL